ncbi:MAG: serine/threonine protein kinase, partial [Deltaproteobacteria bacterium]|nr:serine/threonine protein kinase [Deltaproteobacteria bacterium]MBW2530830.1 serine/threonine protein kinase [Deltaproteobacteria bacterium]
MTDETSNAPPVDDLAWLPKPGETVAGKFEVEKVLGHGGMGVVVAAKHTQLGNRVAIKYLRTDLVEEPSAMARFLREAKAAVALRGEHVARVQDVGTLESGSPYMVMEYLTGTDLDAVLLEEETLSVEEAVDFVLQACEALAEAHGQGIVHRDLKPGNLCLTQRPDGSPLIKVLDFGIAKALEQDGDQPSNLTQTGTALGTPMYMSPEQIRDAKAVDPRSDIWALGTVLFQLLSGDPPFVADTLPSLCAKIVADPAPPLETVREDVPPELGAVIARCLKKEPDERYPDVGALAQALEPFAPERAKVHVERVLRIVGAAGAAPELRGAG